MGKEDVCGDLTPALSTATRIACPRQATLTLVDPLERHAGQRRPRAPVAS
jgi:hypothetical protein